MKNVRLKALLGISALTLTLSCTNTVNAASKYAITTANLNFRTGPSTNNQIITTIKKGSKVEIISKNGSWTKIKYNNKEGYSSTQYLKEETTSTTQKSGVVTANVLNIRSGASTSYKVVTKAQKGEEVTILDSQNGWYKVKLSNDKIGWASGDYITVKDTTTPSTNTDTQTTPQVKPQYTTSKTTTNYDLGFEEYARLQNQQNSAYSIDEYKQYMDINKSSNPLQFLRIDSYRDIDVDLLNSKLVGKGVLEGQGQNIASCAKANNIDPVYFISQSILETGHGKSTLAKGVTITEIADENKPIYKVDDSGNKVLDSSGNPILVGYEMIPLDKPTTVYNLYGIGAKDNLPEFKNRALILGTTYAYNHGWTSVKEAINGAASFVANKYIHSSKYNQNTVYELRFNPNNDNMWHQYATDLGYADKIGSLMNQFKEVYTGGEFTFDIPQYKSTSTYSLRNANLKKIDDTHLSIEDITNY